MGRTTNQSRDKTRDKKFKKAGSEYDEVEGAEWNGELSYQENKENANAALQAFNNQQLSSEDEEESESEHSADEDEEESESEHSADENNENSMGEEEEEEEDEESDNEDEIQQVHNQDETVEEELVQMFTRKSLRRIVMRIIMML